MDEHLQHAGNDKPLDKKRWRTPVLLIADLDETAAKPFIPTEGIPAPTFGPAS